MPPINQARAALSAFIATSMLLFASVANGQGSGQGGSSTRSGTLEVIVQDDFDGGQSRRVYFLKDDTSDDLYELKFDRTPPGHLRTGKTITIRGQADGRTIYVDSLDETGSTSTTGIDAEAVAASERRAVVLMVDLADASASSTYTLDQIAANMYTGSRSVDGLFRDSSNNQLGFAPDTDGDGKPDVFGPFKIGLSASTCDYYGWAYAAEDAATAAGIDLSKYQHRVFVLPRYNQLSCSWAGIANVGCGAYCRSWVAEAESPMVFAHELGHNLSMAHAGTDPENDGTTNSAYGDYSDPMGLSRAWHRFNGAHADQMGWSSSTAGSIATVVSSGTYEISPIGSDPATATAPQTLKIEKADSAEFYYLTYRQPTGYDDSLSTTYTRGVNVHRYRGSGYSATNFIKSLGDTESFNDTANELTVTQVSRDGATATVEIAFGTSTGGGTGGGTDDTSCNTATPSVGVSPSIQMVRPGEMVDYSTSVTNLDEATCSKTTFDIAYSGLPTGALSNSGITLSAGASGSVSLSIDTTGLSDGAHDANILASDNDGVDPTHASDGVGNLSIVIDGTAPTAPTDLAGSSGRKGKVSLTWSASFDETAGVKVYTIFRDGVQIGETGSTGFTDANTASGASYAYTVIATDGVGNVSGPSIAANVTVSSSGGGKGGGGHGKGGKKK